MDHLDLASDVVSRAVKRGTDEADCVVIEREEFSVNVRLGEVEQLKDSGSKAIGLRVLRGMRAASSYSSDFTGQGIEKLLDSALESVRFTSEDPCVGLPEPGELGMGAEPESLDLDLRVETGETTGPTLASIESEEAAARQAAAEAALANDDNIQEFERRFGARIRDGSIRPLGIL